MKRQTAAHLDYDQLLQAVVDKSDLSKVVQDHLEGCAGCQREVRRLVQRYDRLGQLAKKMAPEPAQAFRVPQQPAARARWQFKPALALGMIGILTFVFTVWWPQRIQSPDVPVAEVAVNSATDDPVHDPLMDESDDVVADALPVAEVAVNSTTDDLVHDPLMDEIDDLVTDALPVAEMALNSTTDDLVHDPLMDEIDDLVADALPVAYQELASVSESHSVEELIDLIVPVIEEDDDLEPRA